jgi:hypothetical protein
MVPVTLPGTPQANAGQPSYNYSQTSGGRSGVIMTGGSTPTPTYQDAASTTSVLPGGTVGTPVQNNLNNLNSQNPFRSIPPRNIRSGLPQQQPNAQQPISPETSVIEVDNNSKMNPRLPFPPTVLNPQFPPFPGQTQPPK